MLGSGLHFMSSPTVSILNEHIEVIYAGRIFRDDLEKVMSHETNLPRKPTPPRPELLSIPFPYKVGLELSTLGYGGEKHSV